MMKKPMKALIGVAIALGLGAGALGIALPAQASQHNPTHQVSTVDNQKDGETADDGTKSEATDPVDGNGVEDGTADGETADD